MEDEREREIARFSLRRHSQYVVMPSTMIYVSARHSALTISLLNAPQDHDAQAELGVGSGGSCSRALPRSTSRRSSIGKGLRGLWQRLTGRHSEKSQPAPASQHALVDSITEEHHSLQSHAWASSSSAVTNSERQCARGASRSASGLPERVWWSDPSFEVVSDILIPSSDEGVNKLCELRVVATPETATKPFEQSLYTDSNTSKTKLTNIAFPEREPMCNRQVSLVTTSSICEESLQDPLERAAAEEVRINRASFETWYTGLAQYRFGDCECAVQVGAALDPTAKTREVSNISTTAGGRYSMSLRAINHLCEDSEEADYTGAAIYGYGQHKREREIEQQQQSTPRMQETPKFSTFSLTTPTRVPSSRLDAMTIRRTSEGGVQTWTQYWSDIGVMPSIPSIDLYNAQGGRCKSRWAEYGMDRGQEPGRVVRHPQANVDGQQTLNSIVARNDCNGRRDGCVSRKEGNHKHRARRESDPHPLFLQRSVRGVGSLDSGSGASSPSTFSRPTRARSMESGIAQLVARRRLEPTEDADFRRYVLHYQLAASELIAQTAVEAQSKRLTARQSLLNLYGQPVRIGRPRVLDGLLRHQPRPPAPRAEASRVQVMSGEPPVRLRIVESR
ncbi:hypothetical protein BKA62DRAFT_752794 [Auriculariales sp. MPI-PUGE-AT-0066]|nr:hypothetical protein BKA62DRAFT_752794 [Auriculariales sp. MPI-PUGE-AT-0066]